MLFRTRYGWRRWSGLFIASLLLCFILNVSYGSTNRSVAAQPPSSATSLVQQGIEHYQASQFSQAIALWQQALSLAPSAKERAVIHNNLAHAYRQTGKLTQAIAQWEQAIQIQQAAEDAATRHQVAALLTEQAQAYSDLGQHRRAITLLESATKILQKSPDQLTTAAIQGSLGTAYWALGDYDQAVIAHQQGLEIARKLNNPAYISTALNNLGNVYVSRLMRYRYQAELAKIEGDDGEVTALTQLIAQDSASAKQTFEQSVAQSQGLGGLQEVRALLNLNHLLEQLPSSQPAVITQNWQRALALLEKQPDSQDKAYALINLAVGTGAQASHIPPTEGDRGQGSGISEVGSGAKAAYIPQSQSQAVLETALAVAKNIGDTRAESFALGSLGQVYETQGNYPKAMELTRQALFKAQQMNAPDSLYRWHWQAGRILKATGNKQQAIASYEQAIAALQSIRGDIVAANKELQFDFREQVEPVYREMMALLLESPVAGVKSESANQTGTNPIAKALQTLELLKLAELQNFFGDDCVQVALDKGKGDRSLVDANTAVIYSVILDDHTEMILRSPDGSMTNYPVSLGELPLQTAVDELRYALESRDSEAYRLQSKKVYDLLIRPLEADLAAAKPKTLVFINDGVLRKVPMAALYDGKEFLIQKYPIATTPSISLTSRKSLDRKNLKALTVGLSVERAPFAALTNVIAEVTAVKQILGGTELIDQEFTLNNLQAKLQKERYPIIHLATHGKFGVDAESTFLVGFDKRISIEKIDNLLRSRGNEQPVELLTLSACQTAAGDNRSALGIAGVAVRAGVESALATLWYINDEATVPLISEFYQQLRQPNITKAEALQKAQLKMINDPDFDHPAVWSPFILIGNWL